LQQRYDVRGYYQNSYRKIGIRQPFGRRRTIKLASAKNKSLSDLYAEGRKYTFFNEDRAKAKQALLDGIAGQKKAPAKAVKARAAAAASAKPLDPNRAGTQGNTTDTQASAEQRKAENAAADDTKAHQDVRLAKAKAKAAKPKKSKFKKEPNDKK